MRTTPAPLIDVRRSDDRLETNATWLRDRHSVWVGGRPYDPGNTHHGLLLVHNEDTIRPGTGFGTHSHRDMEIVTWVLEGALVHQDSVGNSGLIYRGLPSE
ncbi:pirin family protein [Streptomyces sp. NPDC001093]|uniref:pirin family protein n=1 Tax=Streptomyces sp. NPDC001093 TaxID=3154376 RepID=UPI00331E0837